MLRQKKFLWNPHFSKSAVFILVVAFISLAGMQLLRADEFGIGQFSVNPQSFNPHQGETTAISGVVYYLSSEGNLSSPTITIKINDQLNLPVSVSLLSEEMLREDALDMLSEWSFQANWDGKNERGQIVSHGDYTYTINLDLPNVGKDTESGTITVYGPQQ